MKIKKPAATTPAPMKPKNPTVTIKLIDPDTGHPTDYTVEVDLDLLESIEEHTGQAIMGALLGDMDVQDLTSLSRTEGGSTLILKSLSIATIRRVLAACFEVPIDVVGVMCGNLGIGSVYLQLLPSLVETAMTIFAGASDVAALASDEEPDNRVESPDPTKHSDGSELPASARS